MSDSNCTAKMRRAMPQFVLVYCVAAILLGPTDAGSFTCDNEYGTLCPEESPGEGLVACLRKAGDAGKELSKDCKGWLSMWEACGEDISKFCAGNEADAFLCLTQWTKRADLGQGCASALPPPPEEKKKPRKKSRAKAKRRAHEKAMKLAAEQEEEKNRADEQKKRKKRKRTKKNKKKKKAKRKKAKKQKKKGKQARQRGSDDEAFDEL